MTPVPKTNDVNQHLPTYISVNNLDLITIHHVFLDANSLDSFYPKTFKTFLKFNQKTQYASRALPVETAYVGGNPLPSFLHLRQSTVISFFVDNLIDVPTCFKKSKSLYNTSFELPFLKCINILMRHGNKNQVFKVFNTAVNTFTMTYMERFTKKALTDSWNTLYPILSHLMMKTVPTSDVLNISDHSNTINRNLPARRQLYYDEHIYLKTHNLTKSVFFEIIQKYAPLFTFYVRKVDKKIRKNSRGKSGKYVLTWKYVPEYKRFYLTLRWFLKDTRFQKDKTFYARLLKGMSLILTQPEQSFLVKLRKFSHFFVFNNFKKTLLRTLKAV